MQRGVPAHVYHQDTAVITLVDTRSSLRWKVFHLCSFKKFRLSVCSGFVKRVQVFVKTSNGRFPLILKRVPVLKWFIFLSILRLFILFLPPPRLCWTNFFEVCRGLPCSLTCVTDQWASHRWLWVENCPMSCGWAGFCRPRTPPLGGFSGQMWSLVDVYLKKKKKKVDLCLYVGSSWNKEALHFVNTLRCNIAGRFSWRVTSNVADYAFGMCVHTFPLQTITLVWILLFIDPCYLKRFY